MLHLPLDFREFPGKETHPVRVQPLKATSTGLLENVGVSLIANISYVEFHFPNHFSYMRSDFDRAGISLHDGQYVMFSKILPDKDEFIAYGMVTNQVVGDCHIVNIMKSDILGSRVSVENAQNAKTEGSGTEPAIAKPPIA